MVILENIDIDIDNDMVILENIAIDIDKAILQNIDIDKISNRFKFGISNRAIRSGYEVLDKIYLFKGEENSLIETQSYTHNFQCVYQLERYPFDTQVRTPPTH